MTDFRTLIDLRFTHAAALARAINTLHSHDVFGGCDATEANARDIGTSFLSEILSGKCPVLPKTLTTVEGLMHKQDQVSFVEGENACIEAFHTIIMGHSVRNTLRIEYQSLNLESNKDMHDLLWSNAQEKNAGQEALVSLQGDSNHKSSCVCKDCQ